LKNVLINLSDKRDFDNKTILRMKIDNKMRN